MKRYLGVLILVVSSACGDASSELSPQSVEHDKFGLNPMPLRKPNITKTVESETLPPECDDVSTWAPRAAQEELAVLDEVNTLRAQGVTCGTTVMPPAPPVALDAQLRCAARLHSQDMGERAFFSHENPDGQKAWDRLKEVGYVYRTMGENIAWGQKNAARVMESWTKSELHCLNFMNASFTEMGVGYYVQRDAEHGESHLWTMDLGAR